MNGSVKCIAIDDEPLALDVIVKFCTRMGGVDLRVFSDSSEGLAAVGECKPDIVFLDIEMDGVNGLEIAARLKDEVCVIFTTAYMDYALEGFNLDAVDYLHKPFSYARFETAFSKALRRIEYSRANLSSRTIVVKQEYNNVSIALDDISYIEAMEGYSKIFRDSGKCVVSRVILKNIGLMLPADAFLRVHRSYIVSRAKIRSFNRQEIILSDGTVIPVGRQYSAEIIGILTGRI